MNELVIALTKVCGDKSRSSKSIAAQEMEFTTEHTGMRIFPMAVPSGCEKTHPEEGQFGFLRGIKFIDPQKTF